MAIQAVLVRIDSASAGKHCSDMVFAWAANGEVCAVFGLGILLGVVMGFLIKLGCLRRPQVHLPPRQAARARAEMQLRSLAKADVPPQLRVGFYFDFAAHPFAHAELLTSAKDIVEVLGAIHNYAVDWLARAWQHRRGRVLQDLHSGAKVVGRRPPVNLPGGEADGCIVAPDILIGCCSEPGKSDPDADFGLQLGPRVQVLGGTFDLRSGGIWLGEGVVVEPGAHITGPAIIGARTTLRSGTYVRGDVVVGDGVVLRGELKNSIIMDCAELAHPGYAGDSIVGYKGHFGCQSLTANLGLFGAELVVDVPGPGVTLRVALGRRKVGAVLGDHSQLGCGSVTDPATFLGPQTHVYPLSRLSSGFYGPHEIIKNKPAELGVLSRSKLR